jgi:CheY-like chemotaxis protein
MDVSFLCHNVVARSTLGRRDMTELSPDRVRVLVVDDYRDAADSQAMLLRLWGYDVCVAYSGPAADSWRPDVVLLDVGMPGREVARRLRERAGSRHTLLVAITGHDEADALRRSQTAGFDYHLVKPADPIQLQKLLATRTEAGHL